MSKRWGVLRAWVRRHDETVVGVLIVLVTIFGAYVTWRAAAASATASDLDQRGRQERITEQRRQGELRAEISYEQDLFRSFEEHVALADSLDRDADSVRDSQPNLARPLAAEAEVERAVARSLQSWILGSYLSRRFHPDYQAKDELASLVEDDLELRELQPGRLEEAADIARDKRFWLVVVDTAAIGAIFFLTLALLRTRPAPRGADTGGGVGRWFAVAGASLFGFAICGLVAVELVVEVPPA